MMSDTHSGQPSRPLTIVASRKRLMPAMSTWATAKEIAFTRCAGLPKQRRMNSGTLRTFRPVAEGHHHHAQEEHGGHGAGPEVVHGRHAELSAIGRHPDDLDRA